MIDDQDPFSRPPFADSVSDRHWVRRNASLFGANEAWSALKAVLALVVVLVAVALVSVLFGPSAAAVLFCLLAVALVVLGLRRQRRRRARVPRR